MSDEEHPLIANLLKYSAAPLEDREEGYTQMMLGLAMQAPATRVSIIDEIDRAAQATDDGSSLRQKAQLLTLRRRFADAHDDLKRAGR